MIYSDVRNTHLPALCDDNLNCIILPHFCPCLRFKILFFNILYTCLKSFVFYRLLRLQKDRLQYWWSSTIAQRSQVHPSFILYARHVQIIHFNLEKLETFTCYCTSCCCFSKIWCGFTVHHNYVYYSILLALKVLNGSMFDGQCEVASRWECECL